MVASVAMQELFHKAIACLRVCAQNATRGYADKLGAAQNFRHSEQLKAHPRPCSHPVGLQAHVSPQARAGRGGAAAPCTQRWRGAGHWWLARSLAAGAAAPAPCERPPLEHGSCDALPADAHQQGDNMSSQSTRPDDGCEHACSACCSAVGMSDSRRQLSCGSWPPWSSGQGIETRNPGGGRQLQRAHG